MSEVVNYVPFSTAKWIWAEGTQAKNDFCIFRKVFKITSKVKRPTLRIAADTRYCLNINNNYVVWEGGVNHPSGEAFNGYYDEIDVSKFVKKGDNVIVILCHYHGNSGGTSIDKGRAGLLVEFSNADNVAFVSDADFSVYRNEAFKSLADDVANVKFAGWSFSYDATIERPLTGIYTTTYNSNIFVKSEELCNYGEQPFGELTRRSIPYYSFNQKVKIVKKDKQDKDENTYLYKMVLPRAMYVYPVISAKALGMEKIRIYSDRTETFGDVGDKNKYTGYTMEYICKAQKQLFESFVSMYGQIIYFEIPKTVKLAKLGYRYVEYNSEVVASFQCNDGQINGLAEKCINTLKACLTDSIINNVERDRALTLDAANIAVRTLLSTFDEGSHAIIRKTLADILDNTKDGAVQNNVLSLNPEEIPAMGLLTFSGEGMFAAYSNYFADMDQRFLDAGINYLSKWDMVEGLVEPKGGFMDNLYNIDSAVLENCLYYSALGFMKRLATKLGNFEHDAFLKERLENFRSAFAAKYFNGIGFSSQPNYNDDRANAFAVLTGLCGEDKYAALSDLLVSVQNASPYFEGYVLQAIGKMGRSEYAQRRMVARYAGMVESYSSTLREDFCLGGAQTSSRSVMPIAVMLESFAGVSVKDAGNEITITPNMGDLNSISFTCALPKNAIRGEYRRGMNGVCEYTIINESKTEALVVLKGTNGKEDRTFKISKGKYKYTSE